MYREGTIGYGAPSASDEEAIHRHPRASDDPSMIAA
jgi:hypothetical protein